MRPLLEVEGLKKTYPGFQLNGVSFSIYERGIFELHNFLRRAMQEKHAFRSSCRDLCLRPLLCAIGSYCRMSGRNGSHVADWAAGSR